MTNSQKATSTHPVPLTSKERAALHKRAEQWARATGVRTNRGPLAPFMRWAAFHVVIPNISTPLEEVMQAPDTSTETQAAQPA